MIVGDKVKGRMFSGRFMSTMMPECEGTVIAVNPEKRNYTVEFEIDGVKLRETFFDWEGVRNDGETGKTESTYWTDDFECRRLV